MGRRFFSSRKELVTDMAKLSSDPLLSVSCVDIDYDCPISTNAGYLCRACLGAACWTVSGAAAQVIEIQ